MRTTCGTPTSPSRGAGPEPVDTARRGHMEKRAPEHSNRPHLQDASAEWESNLLRAGGEVGINPGPHPDPGRPRCLVDSRQDA